MVDDLKKIVRNELLELAISKRNPSNKQGFTDYISKTGELMKNSNTVNEFFSLEEKRDLAKLYLRFYYDSYVDESYIPVPKDVN